MELMLFAQIRSNFYAAKQLQLLDFNTSVTCFDAKNLNIFSLFLCSY